MSGVSHGGCVTARALERGAPVHAAIDVYGAADWSLTYNECVSPGSTFCDDLRASLQVWLGGTPAAKPIAYDWRSPRFKDAIADILAGDLTARKDVKILLQHGTADTIVYAKQSCMLEADALGTAKRYHVNTAGAGVTTSVPGCTSGWESTARPTTSWPNQSYLIVYDGYTHGGGTTLHACRDYYRFINALDWAADIDEAVACPGP